MASGSDSPATTISSDSASQLQAEGTASSRLGPVENVNRPNVLIADEPTGNLDHASAQVVASLLLELNARRKSILIVVTHSAELGAKFPVRFELLEQKLCAQ